MTARQILEQILSELSEDRVKEVLDFAKFLNSQEERETWSALGRAQLANAYGDDEPEYTEADVKPELDSPEQLRECSRLPSSPQDQKPRLMSDGGNGPRPGVCLDDNAKLLDVMER